MRAGRDDRRERRRLGPAPAHRRLEVERDVALGAAHQPALEDLLERRVRERGGGADGVELGRVLDQAQRLDRPAGGDELDVLAHERAQPAVLADRELGVVEAEPQRPLGG